MQYEVGSRTGSGLDEQALTDIGEHPEMRHYDLADRTRNRFTGQVDIVPSDAWMFSVSGGLLHDDYGDTVFGLQKSNGNTFSLAADYHLPNGMGAGATYNFERYTGLQQSHEGIRQTRSSTIPCATGRPTRPRRSTIFPSTRRRPASAATPRCGSRTISATRQAITSTRFRRAARFRRPISCRRCSTSCSSCTSTRATGSRRTSRRTFSYLYEPLNIYDYAFDPSVVNGIVQPSSLVMGYVYRPYTANSVVFGMQYRW